MRIVIDLDGTICEPKVPGQTYAEVAALPGAITAVNELRRSGHYIIIYTARNMQTCEGNLGKVIRNVGKLTLDWLAVNGVEFDEIYFGKPLADVYIDDRSFRFVSWDEITEDSLVAIGTKE